MKNIVIIIIILAIALMQLPGLVKKKQWKVLVVVSVLLTISFTLSLLLSFGVKISNPHKGINAFIEALVY